jgi:hypothetical protein
MKSLRIACLFAAAAAAAAGALAQSPAPPPIPANAMPPPIPANATPPPIPANATPPPASPKSAAPPEVYGEPDLEPQVTIIRKDAETVEEIRVNGELRYVRVTPRGGKTYYLVPNSNGRNFIRYDSLGSNLSVPMWLLFSW